MRISYIVTGRYPTERAYGIQINKTVDALRSLGAEVVVRSPALSLQGILALGPVGYWLRTIIFVKWLWLSGALRGQDVLYTRDPLAARLLALVSHKIFLELHDIGRASSTRVAVRKVSGVFVISKGLALHVHSWDTGWAKIAVIPDAVDIDKFSVPIEQAQAREQFNLPTDKKIVLYAGLFDEWKGYKTLLEASKQFGSDTKLVMAGGREEQVAALSKEYPAVRFLGWTDYDKLPVLQKTADVLVLPNSARFEISRVYTSPLKLFAYMASGVPIVAADLPSIREVLDEDSALFVVPDDPAALASGITTLLANPALGQRLASKAFHRVQTCTWQKRARAILDFLQKHAHHNSNSNLQRGG